MEILVTYFLVLGIFCTWQFAIKAAVKRIFKNFLYIETQRFISRAKEKNKKERYRFYYTSACDFIDKFNFREANKIIAAIQRSRKDVPNQTYPKTVCDEDLEKYSEIAVKTIYASLKACTVMGFIHFFSYMGVAFARQLLQGIAKPLQLFIEKFMESIARKEPPLGDPAYIFSRFGAAAS